MGVRVAVAVGLLLRAYHYLRCPAVWHDEAALIVNVLGRSVGDVFGPLLHDEAAPPLFLAVERAVVLLLGDGEYALRLVPFLASCLSLLIFAALARRTLEPLTAALAVGLFAVSDRLLWHSCEAKPYALDVLVAVSAAWWLARTEGWPLWKRCLPAAVLAPPAIWVAFPACFVLGGLLLALFPLVRTAGWRDRAAFALLVVSVGGAFLAFALGPAAAQRTDAMAACWDGHFPNWSRPWMVPVWAIAGTFEVARYCLLPLGQVVLVFAVVGGVSFWKRDAGRRLVVALAVPVALALVAAGLHKYPYGGSRLEVFACPALCVLGAEGVRVAVRWAAPRSRTLAVLVVLLALVPVGLTAYRVVRPWERAAHDEAAEYVLARRADGDVILVNHWEDEYYFRGVPGWRSWDFRFRREDLEAGRVWVVMSQDRAAEVFPLPVPAGWRVADARPFLRVAVFRLERDPSPSRDR